MAGFFSGVPERIPFGGLDSDDPYSFKVYDASGGSSQQVADIWPSLLGADNANAVARAFRNGNAWKLEVQFTAMPFSA